MKTLVFLILSLSLLSGAEPGFESNQFSVSISGSDGKPVPDSQISLITNDGMIRQKGVAGADGLFTFEKPNKSSVLFAAAPYHESARLRYEGQGIVLMTLKASPDKSSIISEGYTRLLGREGYIYPFSKTYMRSDGIRFRKKETEVTYSVGGIINATDTKGERFKIYVKEAIHPIYLIEYTSPKVSQVERPSLVSRPTPQKSGFRNEIKSTSLNDIKSTGLNDIKLTSLTPKDYSVGYADLFVGHNVGNFEVYLRGNPCKDYIFAHSPSRILYDIPGAATTFSAYGIRPAGDENIAGSWIYIVRIDGKEVFKSKPLSTYPKLEVPIVAPIPAGSREIELIIDPIKNNFADHSIWAKPTFK